MNLGAKMMLTGKGGLPRRAVVLPLVMSGCRTDRRLPLPWHYFPLHRTRGKQRSSLCLLAVQRAARQSGELADRLRIQRSAILFIRVEKPVRFTYRPKRASAERSGERHLPSEVSPGNKRHIFAPSSVVAGISWRVPPRKLRGYHVGHQHIVEESPLISPQPPKTQLEQIAEWLYGRALVMASSQFTIAACIAIR
jgi:hypothetical protein